MAEVLGDFDLLASLIFYYSYFISKKAVDNLQLLNTQNVHTMQLKKGKQMKITAMVLLVLTLTACGNTQGERAVSGGLLGAGGGAALGSVTGLGAGTGALIGGAGGAGYGALTAPPRRNYYRGY